ncbi:MAG: hypothetical protein Q8S84_05920 [bacterium]|nr:hypothetical protein [bacterium]MDP3381016.1 hypothetical protein [bacterium]
MVSNICFSMLCFLLERIFRFLLNNSLICSRGVSICLFIQELYIEKLNISLYSELFISSFNFILVLIDLSAFWFIFSNHVLI